ncbi:MAG: diguanylate cyclase [Acidimicrobiales bacterium]|nr:diguanylate cyclase [Acidimicrobiales bacterium]
MKPRPGTALLTTGERWSLLWPFISAFLLAFALGWLPSTGGRHLALKLAASVLILSTGASILLGLWARLPAGSALVPVIALCVAVDLMRAADGSGSAAGFTSLLLIPVIWQALHGRQRDLTLTIGTVSIANITSILLLPSPVHGVAQWRAMILFTAVAATIGQTIRRLVQERETLLAKITALALLDPLTGLPNRRTWDDRLPVALQTAARTKLPLAIAIFDIDHFKAYNDEHGHQAGDELLATAGTAWGSTLRAIDLLARWGGEEFALLLPATDAPGARLVLDRLQQVMPEGQTFSAGFTIVHVQPPEMPDPLALMLAADRAMYAAKAAGRGRSACAQDLAGSPTGVPVASDLVHSNASRP